MARNERRLLIVWALLTATVVAVIVAWPLVLILMIFVPPLGFVLLATPTVWLYLTAAGVFYLPLRVLVPGPRRILFGAGVAAAAALGFLIPTLANRALDRRVAGLAAEEMGEKPLLRTVGSIAILTGPRELAGDGQCRDECQRLLFSGLTTTVLQGSLEPGAPVMRHRIVPISQRCDNTYLAAVAADRGEYAGPPPVAYLWEKLQPLAAEGKCFRSDRSSDRTADLYFITQFDGDATSRREREFDLALGRIEPALRRTILRRQEGHLVPVMRRIHFDFTRLSVPLTFVAPIGFDVWAPGHWGRATGGEHGAETIERPMQEWLRNDVRLTGLGKQRKETPSAR